MQIVITLTDMIYIGTFIIFLIVLGGAILFEVFKDKFNAKYRQDCYKCKYYDLHNVASAGDMCWYKCELKGRVDSHSFNDRANYIKCKEFELEEK